MPEGDVHPPALAPGQVADPFAVLAGQADQFDRLPDRPGPAVVPGEHGDGLADRVDGVELAVLQDETDAVLPRPVGVGGVGAQHADRATVAVAVALEDLDGRGLAGTVGAEQAEDLATTNVQRRAADGLEGAVALAQPVDRYDLVT